MIQQLLIVLMTLILAGYVLDCWGPWNLRFHLGPGQSRSTPPRKRNKSLK